MRAMRVLVTICALTATLLTVAQAAPFLYWRLDGDADHDGIADGWAADAQSGKAVLSLGDDPTGGIAQHVTGAEKGDALQHEIAGLDPKATYLVRAIVTVMEGSVVWGVKDGPQKYLASYNRTVESRLTLTGRDAITLVFIAQEPPTSFVVSSVRIERIEKSPLPLEADTGRFLVPRPRSLQYTPGETAACILRADSPVALAGLQLEGLNLGLVREDLGFTGDASVVEPRALTTASGPGLLIGTPEGLRAVAATLPAALATVVNASPTVLPEEGYYLAVRPEGVVLVAAREVAGQYGLQTLRQLCAKAGDGHWRIPQLTISDAPAMPFRGTYQGGDTANPDRLARAKYYARLKLNAVVMEDSILYHLREGDNLTRVRDYYATLRSLHLEPIPLVQSFGWGMYLLAIDPQCVEAKYVQDHPVQFARREAVAPEGRDAVPDDGREYLVWPQDMAPLTPPLANPSFEQLTAGRPVGWQADRWAETDGATVKTGPNYLQLSRTTKGQLRVWQDFELPTNRELQFTMNLKLQSIDGAGAYAEIYRITENHELVGSPAVMTTWLKGTRDWAPTKMTLDTGDHRWYRIYLRIQDATGTACFGDLRVKPATARLQNLVHVDESLRLTDDTGTVFVAGRDYEVVPGETRFPFTEDAKPWQIVRLPGGRIPAGAQLRLSYDYAPAGAVTYCPSDPRTQAIMRDTLTTVIRELGVKYVHIGHDEPRWMNTCRRCRERHLSNAEIFADELIRMQRYVKEANPQVRVMMWDDALNPYHNAPAQELEPANDTTPKDLIQCSWFYSARDDLKEARSLEYLAKRGYETTGSPWFDLENNWDWAQECNLSRQMTGKCLGVLYTSWADNPNVDQWAGLSVSAAFAWNPDDPLALEMLPWSPAEMNRTRGVLP